MVSFLSIPDGLDEAKKPYPATVLFREGFLILPYNELVVAQGPKIHQKNKL